MSRTTLLFDANNSMRRFWHSMGSAAIGKDPVGATYGFLRELKALTARFQTEDVAFCFDSGSSRRREDVPTYKQNRLKRQATITREEQTSLQHFYAEINALQTEVLPQLGYRNVFCQPGYEADDLIASLVNSAYVARRDPSVVIISSDKDLYQLLNSECVVMWLPHRKMIYTEDLLKQEFHGVTPAQWPLIQAIAGCPGDGVVGIPSIGLTFASKYVTQQLNPRTKAYGKIVGGRKIIERNLPLVTLPYPGTEWLQPRPDRVTKHKWTTVCARLGIDW